MQGHSVTMEWIVSDGDKGNASPGTAKASHRLVLAELLQPGACTSLSLGAGGCSGLGSAGSPLGALCCGSFWGCSRSVPVPGQGCPAGDRLGHVCSSAAFSLSQQPALTHPDL